MRGRIKRIGIVLCCLVSISMFSYCLLPVKADAAARFSCSHEMVMYQGEIGTGEYGSDATGHWEKMETRVICGSCGEEFATRTYWGPKQEHDMAAFTEGGVIVIKCRICGEEEH